MADLVPDSIEVTDIQFIHQSKVKLFNSVSDDLNNVNLLATASNQGLVFCGTPGNDLKVIRLNSLTNDDFNENNVPVRTVTLPGKAKQISISCDDSMLAVDITKNGVPFLQIFSVQSFYANDVVLLNEIPVPGQNHGHTISLLWNPVQNNVLAVVTEHGELFIFTIKQPGFEMCKYDGSEAVQSACWSPKGKQIVAGFANGKLVQFKPDLKPARQIPCPPGVIDGEFNVIALQWLATYQFAAVFQSKDEDTTPALYIINAPKTGNPVYINYDDITYGQVGPRQAQVFLIHILQWNLLVVASANSIEVGLLASNGEGDCPQWTQYCLSEFRAELPLNESKEDTYPLGMALDTGCVHNLVIKEIEYPVSPMLHLLSTDGILISFNFLNTFPNTPNINSPPAPVSNQSGLSKFVVQQLTTEKPAAPTPPQVVAATPPTTPVKQQDFSFNSGQTLASSTPATKAPQMSSFGSGFGGQMTMPAPSFAALTEQKPFQPKPQTDFFQQPQFMQPQQPPQIQKSQPAKTEPLITVPPSYTAPTFVAAQKIAQPAQTDKTDTDSSLPEDIRVVKHMINDELKALNRDLDELTKRSNATNYNVGSKEEQQQMTKSLNELQRFTNEAVEANESLSADIRSLRLSLNETFAMAAEARKKNSAAKGQDNFDLPLSMTIHHTGKRQLAKLEKTLLVNETQLEVIVRQLDSQWCEHEDMLKQRRRATMKIPGLENVYQTLTKQRDIIERNKVKINEIKARLGLRDTIQSLKSFTSDTKAIESLTDSIISMTIVDQVRAETEKLSPKKVRNLREALKNRKIVIVRPFRPERPDINSEIVREKRETVRRFVRSSEKKNDASVVVAEQKSQKAPQPVKQQPVQPRPQPTNITMTMTSKPFEPVQPTMSFIKAHPSTTSAPSVSFVAPSFQKQQFVQAPKVETSKAPVVSTKPVVTSQPSSTAKPEMLFGTTSISPVVKSDAVKPSLTSGLPKPVVELPKPNFNFGASFKAFEKLAETTESSVTKPENEEPLEGLLNMVLNSQPTVTQPSSVSAGATTITSKPSPSPAFGSATLSFGNTFSSPKLSTSSDTTATITKPTPKTTSFFSGSVTVSSSPSIFGGVTKQPPITTVATVQSFVSPVVTSTTSSPTTDFPKPFGSVPPTTPKFAELSPLEGTKKEEKTPIATSATSSPLFATTPKPVSTFSFGASGASAFGATSPPIKPVDKPTEGLFSSFGANSPATSTGAGNSPSIFGSNTSFTAPKVESSPIFGGNANQSPQISSAPSPFASFANTPSAPANTSPAVQPAEKATEGLFSSFNICSPSTPPSSGNASNIFGANTSFASPKADTTSIFGGNANQSPQTNAAPSPFASFGNANASTGFPKPEQNVFGSSNSGSFGAASPAPQTSSIFGGGVASQVKPEEKPATGGLFSSFNAFSSPSAATPGNTTNLFGGSTTFGAAKTETASIFGGNANQSPQTSAAPSPFFGSAPAFPKPEQNVFASSMSAFAKPTFGSSPTFGGAPVFGSKSPLFGSVAQPTAVANTGQSNNLFAQLGSSDTGMSFGSLAQSTFPPQQQQQPQQNQPSTFGGSAFSSWR